MRNKTIVVAILLGLALGIIVAPRYFTGQTASPHGVAVTWTLPASEPTGTTVTGFAIWRAPSTSGVCGLYGVVGNVTGSTVTSWNDPPSDLANSTSYCYDVQTIATNSSGAADSGPSNSAPVTTPSTWPGNANPPTGCNANVF